MPSFNVSRPFSLPEGDGPAVAAWVAPMNLCPQNLSTTVSPFAFRPGGLSLFCNQCGGRIADGSVFCNLCGAKQGVVVPAQGAPGPSPGYPGQTPAPVGVPMGQAYNPGAPVQAMAAPPMPQTLKCNSCGAPMNPSAGLALVVCEYCGAVTTMGAGGAAQVFQKHFMLDSRISNEQALEAGGKWLNKGVFRRKVAERSELGQVTLKYVPYWIVPTSVVADFQGTKNVVGAGTGMMTAGNTGAKKAAGAALFALSIAAAASQKGQVRAGPAQPQVIRVRDRVQMQYNIPIVGVRGYVKYQPDDGFQFQLQNKGAFDKRRTGGVAIESGDVGEPEAKAQAAALAHKFADREARKRVDNLESIQVYPTTYDGELLHAPVWFMEYAHKGKAMFILIDGHSGTVMDGERPSFALW